MLPSRSRLQGWNPDSLSPAGKAIDAAGQSVYGAVRDLEDGIDRLPAAGAWEGRAHDAAAAMFGRATRQTSDFATDVGAVGKTLSDGDSTIGAARYRLLRAADDIDEGELQVSDQWVVLIKPARMSADHAAELQKQAEQAQAEINQLLLALGDADDRTAANVQAAAKKLGFDPPKPNTLGGLLGTVEPQPGDEVPNPRTIQGMYQQATIRGEDMGTNIRDSTETRDKDGNDVKTVTMQDGSKHVITTYRSANTPKLDHVVDERFGKDGKFISRTASWKELNGVKWTQVDWGEKTYLTISETPDGERTAGWILPDGRHGAVPGDNPLFTGSVPDLENVGLSGLGAHIGRGGGIPMLTPESVKDIGKGLKFIGPELAITNALYKGAAGGTVHDVCVAATEGGFGYFAGDAGAGLGADLGAAVGAAVPLPGAEPFTIPLFAILGGYAFGKFGESLGTKVGETFCP